MCIPTPPHFDPSDFAGYTPAQVLAGLTTPATSETPAPRRDVRAPEREAG